MHRKTILIGLDGATWDNLMPWIKQGKLLFFKEIIEKGVHGINKTTIPCLTCPAIPSFYTGKTPVKTKVFGFRKTDGKIISSNDIKEKRFWDHLGEAGFNSIIANLRITYPPKIKKGVMISSMMTPSEKSEFVYPQEEKMHFEGFMNNKLDKWQMTKIEADRKKLLQLLLKDELARFSMYTSYIKKKKYDFEFFYFGCTDTIQHRLWNSQNLVLEGYKKIESALKEYLNNNKNANILIFSDHGFGNRPNKTFFIENWLQKEALLYYKNPMIRKAVEYYKKAYYAIGLYVLKLFPPKYYNKIYQFIHNKKLDLKFEIAIDPPKTSMFYLDTKKTIAYLSQNWGISLIKENITNYELIRTSIITKLKKIKDETQKPVFKDILCKEKVYPGSEKYDIIPDIIFLLNDEFEIRTGQNEKMIKKTNNNFRVEGSHDYKRNGIFMAFGPDIKQGTKIKAIDIYDLAPTILHMYGAPLPKDMDGRVLKEIFQDKSPLHNQKIKFIKKSIKINMKCFKI